MARTLVLIASLAIICLLAFLTVSVAVILWAPSGDQARGRGAPFVGIPIGLIFMGAALIDLAKRLLSGPTKPGKSSRF